MSKFSYLYSNDYYTDLFIRIYLQLRDQTIKINNNNTNISNISKIINKDINEENIMVIENAVLIFTSIVLNEQSY